MFFIPRKVNETSETTPESYLKRRHDKSCSGISLAMKTQIAELL